MRGGNRPGAGRKPGSVSAARTRLQQTARDVAAQVLSEVDAVAIWKKLILQQEKPYEQESYLLSIGLELSSHLKGYGASKRVPTQKIRLRRLNRPRLG